MSDVWSEQEAFHKQALVSKNGQLRNTKVYEGGACGAVILHYYS